MMLRERTVYRIGIILVTILVLTAATMSQAAETRQILQLPEYGEVYSFGHNSRGTLGHGDEINRLVPAKIEGLGSVIAVEAHSHSLVLLRNGDAYAFGSNRWGQLGLGDKEDRNTPTKIRGIGRVKAISAGDRHSLIVLENGDVYSFGNNGFGQLGHGDTVQRLTPSKIGGISNARAVAAGSYHSLVLLENGSVYSFGYNGENQLGQGEGAELTCHSPVRIEVLGKAKALSAGYNHSLVLLQNDDVFAFGNNRFGQLGYRTIGGSSTIPTKLRSVGPARAVAAGVHYSLMLLENGDVYSFGSNSSGKLGHGDTKRRYHPTKIAGLGKASMIAAGESHSLVVLENGQVYSFGLGQAGRLGHGVQDNMRTPTLIEALHEQRVLDTAAGYGHSLVLIATPPRIMDRPRIETDLPSVIR